MHYSFIQTHLPLINVVRVPAQCQAHRACRELQKGCAVQRRLLFVRVWGRTEEGLEGGTESNPHSAGLTGSAYFCQVWL